LIGPLLAPIIANEEIPQTVRDLLAVGVNPEQANELSVILIIAGALIFPLVQSFLAPAAEAVSQTAWAIPGNDILQLTPAVLTAAVLKGVLDEQTAADVVAHIGLNATKFHTMVQAAGNAIGIDEALLLWRRGDIDETEFERVARYSNMNDSFIPDAKKLRFFQPSAAEAIAGRLKGHLSDADARTFYEQAGAELRNFDWQLATAGRPYGIEQALHLWNRGVIGQARVEQVVAQSDINPDYTADILELRKYFPPPRSIVPMLRAGAITEAQARTLLSYYGVDAEWVDAFIGEASSTRTAAAREVGAAQVVRAYEEAIITGAEATARLTALRYPAADAALLLEIADNAVVERYRNALVGAIHTRYVSHKLSRADAVTQLGQAGLPSAAQSEALRFWDIERTTRDGQLTVAQTQGALRRDVLTLTDFIARMHDFGYSGIEVKVLAAEAFPPTGVPPNILALDPATL